jgi:S1-C subfamily serine protease
VPKPVGWDHWTDLAVLRLDMAEVTKRGWKIRAAEFGPSEKLFPGQEVYAVGTPHGLAPQPLPAVSSPILPVTLRTRAV